jgi:hypothetical protein
MNTHSLQVDPYIAERSKPVMQLLNEAEENLAYNLHWLADELDLKIRQGDKEVVERLAMLNQAWRMIVFAAAKIEKGEA